MCFLLASVLLAQCSVYIYDEFTKSWFLYAEEFQYGNTSQEYMTQTASRYQEYMFV